MSPDKNRNPHLGIDGFRYADLYDHQRLADLSFAFDRFVGQRDVALFPRFDAYRAAVQGGVQHGGLNPPDESELLIAVSRCLGAYLAQMFQVEAEASVLRARAERDAEVVRFKKEFVAKRVTKVQAVTVDADRLATLDKAAEAIVRVAGGEVPERDAEHALAVAVNRLGDLEKEYPRNLTAAKPLAPSAAARATFGEILERLRGERDAVAILGDTLSEDDSATAEAAALHAISDLLIEWTAGRWKQPKGVWNFKDWTSFRLPHPLVFDHLVHTVPVDEIHVAGEPEHLRRRDGFALTDPRYTPRQVADEANYCIFCHERKKDSCAHGFQEKDGKFKVNPIGLPLEGCPLDEKIGEMNALCAEGDSIAALAMVMIDNPMCPGTGHRICNDCMRSCIFQKQDPVNIPQVETGVLTDVLFLPWGFEIYSLLTRWNPLDARRPMALSYNGKNVLVVGLGPAGYTLAHYLANEGFGVVGIDGLKIEPLPAAWIGDEHTPPEPIRDFRQLWDPLDDRILAGFGGVSEYGITVRWDKNFLKVIRIALERKRNVRFYGGVRFGGTLCIDDVFDELAFDHIAIAAGAGTPTIVKMKNNLLRGMRMASDFLMALQLTGAYKKNSMANLQVRLPAVVIGGGLTAIDTATELFAYYPTQVHKLVERYEAMSHELGEVAVRAGYDAEELGILDELVGHGRAIRAERERAAGAGEPPDFIPLVRSWGGVTIAYRKSLIDSPAYRLNYEEVAKSFEEGISYAEKLSPVEAVADEYGHVKSILFQRQIVENGRWKESSEVVEMPARCVMVAAGTSPNVIYEREHPGTFKLDKWNQFFQSHTISIGESGRPELVAIDPERETGFFTSYQHPSSPSKLVTFYGDNHPRYAGNVVKAMASAKFGFPQVARIFEHELMAMDRSADAQAGRDDRWRELTAALSDALLPTVHAVNRLTPTIVEVVVRAPCAARHFEPGQFYRLQNFETTAHEIGGTKMVMEGLALTGAWTKPDEGLLSLIILEMGGSSRLCAHLEPGERVVVMGPTGTPTEIPSNETILLAGGGLGNAVLFSIARALKGAGCRVIYFAGYKKQQDVFKRDDIEAGTDQVVWAVDAGDPILPRRPQDLCFIGNIVQAMTAYANGDILARPENAGRRAAARVDLAEASRVIAIGSDGMMRAVKDARHGVLAPYLSPEHIGIGSINSPMQCMMKQVCAQCLQRHVDPITGKETFVFSCLNQDQKLDEVDFNNLRARLRQNTVLEKLTNLWLTRLLAKEPVGVG